MIKQITNTYVPVNIEVEEGLDEAKIRSDDNKERGAEDGLS